MNINEWQIYSTDFSSMNYNNVWILHTNWQHIPTLEIQIIFYRIQSLGNAESIRKINQEKNYST